MSDPARLADVLEEARQAGFLGPGPVVAHVRHAEGLVAVAEAAVPGAPATFVDLGSGGGVPGLVCGLRWPEARGLLIEAMARRARFLERAATALDLRDRVVVVHARAEDVAREPAHREATAVVTARSFARPAVTAEIGAGLLELGGVLVVSEPPEADPGRWPEEPLGALGLGVPAVVEYAGARYVWLRKIHPAGAEVPRAARHLAKRPLW